MESWVAKSSTVAKIFTLDDSFTPMTLIIMRNAMITIDMAVPATGESFRGAQKCPR